LGKGYSLLILGRNIAETANFGSKNAGVSLDSIGKRHFIGPCCILKVKNNLLK
jgi:hypothetical protein